jgi:hypothetical protein
MSRLRRNPRSVNVAPDGNEEHSLASLRYAKARGIQQDGLDVVVHLAHGFVAAVYRTQRVEMAFPALGVERILRHDERVTELKLNECDKFGQILAQQTFNILNHHRTRPSLANRTEHLREEVSLILVGSMPASNRKGLTRCASCEQVDALVRREVETLDVALLDSAAPVTEKSVVLPQRLTCVVVVLEEKLVLKTGISDSERKASRSGEEFDRGQAWPGHTANLSRRYRCAIIILLQPQILLEMTG